jgi:hypothetical protein
MAQMHGNIQEYLRYIKYYIYIYIYIYSAFVGLANIQRDLRCFVIYAAYGGNSYRHFGTTSRSHFPVQEIQEHFLTLEDGTIYLSRNIDKEFPPYAAKYPRKAQVSSTSRRKPEIT